jgi:cell division transport system permease protein
MVSSLANTLKTTGHNIKANKQVFVLSVTTVAVAFSVLGLFFLVHANLNALLSTWNKQVQLVIYLDDGISKTRMKALKKLFDDNERIDSAHYISRDTAWKNFKSTFAEKSGFVAGLDINPLPASYSLKFKAGPDRLKHIRQLTDELREGEGIESMEYGEKWISKFENFMIFLRVFILAVGGILGVGLVLIISNTVKLSIFSRREEIELMLLVGATHRSIRVPLILEGVVQGLSGVGIALGLIKLVHLYIQLQFQGSLESIFRGADLQFITQSLLWPMLVGGVVIGWVGSQISINQFLHSEARR